MKPEFWFAYVFPLYRRIVRPTSLTQTRPKPKAKRAETHSRHCFDVEDTGLFESPALRWLLNGEVQPTICFNQKLACVSLRLHRLVARHPKAKKIKKRPLYSHIIPTSTLLCLVALEISGTYTLIAAQKQSCSISNLPTWPSRWSNPPTSATQLSCGRWHLHQRTSSKVAPPRGGHLHKASFMKHGNTVG